MVANQTVRLVNLWAAFEAEHPGAGIEDFCRHYLASIETRHGDTPPPGELRPDLNGQLMILLRRIGKFHITYSNKALEGTGLDQMEEFGILVTIYNQKNPIKSEAIYNNIIELSSGSNMLIRLKKRGLVSEFVSDEDKRVKRLELTPKGVATLLKAKDFVLQVAHMMVYDLSDEDKRLCIQLLRPIDERFSGLYAKQKSKSWEEIYKENTSAS
jgi:DNA-binding MarR family transcriptional regulator